MGTAQKFEVMLGNFWIVEIYIGRSYANRSLINSMVQSFP